MATGTAALRIMIAALPALEPSSAPGGLAAAWGWREVSPARVRGQEFLALSGVPGRPDRALALDEQGGVWLSEDAGQTWALTLPPRSSLSAGTGPDAEEVLLEAEALAIDLFAEQARVPTEEEALEDPDAVQEATEQAVTTMNTEAVGLDQLVRQDAAWGDAAGAALLWANPQVEDELWLGRADGLWLSTDAGERWQRRDEGLRPRCMAAPDEATLLAGLAEGDPGLRISTDGGARWEPVAGPLASLPILDLARHPQSGRWLAATSAGLYSSDDALTWTRAPGSPAEPVRALLPDSASADGAWLATGQRVLRTDDGGARVFSLSRTPLPGAVRLSPGLLPNELLYAGADGVWESRDGGVSWSPVNEGLRTPQVYDLVGVGGVWLAATAQGLLRLEPLTRAEQAQGAVVHPLSLPSTVDIALSRTGMSPLDAGLVARSTAARRFMPELRVVGDAWVRRGLSADYTTRTNESFLEEEIAEGKLEELEGITKETPH